MRWLAIGLAITACACGQTSADDSGGILLDSGSDVVTEAAVESGMDAGAEPDRGAKPPCVASGQNASAAGTHPGGTFDAKHAIFWQTSGECSTSLGILFTEVPAIVERDPDTWPDPTLVIYVDDDVGVDPAIGFELRANGSVIQDYDTGTADMITESYEPTGSFTIQTDSVNISGTFAPDYCPELDIFCP